MPRSVEGVVVTEKEPDGECSMCGMVKETRPYGIGGSPVCFECGMKDEETARHHFGALFPQSEEKA